MSGVEKLPGELLQRASLRAGEYAWRLAEGRKGFGRHLDALEAAGTDPRDAMCFVWYAISADDD